jgi:uncharacterized damage-inducible protein DinB
MRNAVEGLLFCWRKNLDYAQKLVADLDENQMTLQPASDPDAPSNHPAWILSHLNVYVPIVSAIIDGESFEDPKGHQFGMNSKPETDPAIYAPKAELIGEYVASHQQVIKQLEQADDSVLGHPTKLARWESVMPTAAMALPYLMLNHENGHLGQLSAWRRIQGMPSV